MSELEAVAKGVELEGIGKRTGPGAWLLTGLRVTVPLWGLLILMGFAIRMVSIFLTETEERILRLEHDSAVSRIILYKAFPSEAVEAETLLRRLRVVPTPKAENEG